MGLQVDAAVLLSKVEVSALLFDKLNFDSLSSFYDRRVEIQEVLKNTPLMTSHYSFGYAIPWYVPLA